VADGVDMWVSASVSCGVVAGRAQGTIVDTMETRHTA